MIHFVVVSGSPRAVDALAGRLFPSLECSRLFDGERIERVGGSRTWAVAGIAVPDPVCRARFIVDEEAMVVLNGPAMAASGDQDRLARDTLEAFRTGGSQAVAQSLTGSFNFVGVAPSNGLCAFRDFSGLFPLYWYESPDFVAVSNRSMTIRNLVGGDTWDLRALAWVIGHANLFGDDMPAEGVRYLPPGRELRAEWADARPRCCRSPDWVWPDGHDDVGRDNLGADEWDEVTDELVANFGSLRTLDRRMSLSLSGGKDSRLCLALAQAGGLQDCVETGTNGTPESPDVQCAAAVARTAGFRHRRVDPPVAGRDGVPKVRAFDPEAIWRRLRQHVYRHEAIVCPWDGTTDPLRGTDLLLKGFGGELYRRSHAKRFRRVQPTSVEEMGEMFVDYHQPIDPLGVLHGEEVRRQAAWLATWVAESVEDVRLDLLPEKFYVDHRLSHWNGPMGQGTPGRINLNPLLLGKAAKKAFQLSAQARGTDRLHFEVLRRVSPELAAIPFVNDTWAPEIAGDARIELPRHPYPAQARLITHAGRSWQWQFLATEGPSIERLFDEAARETEMGAICDMAKLGRIARDAARITDLVEAKAVLSCISVALALLGRAEPFRDRP